MDYGIKVSNGTVNASDAGVEDLILSSRYPFEKLDTLNTVSFRNIKLTFNNDPPEPIAPDENKQTLVYTLQHGYSYKPRFWAVWNKKIGLSYSNDYLCDISPAFIAANSSDDGASLFLRSDSTNIYFYVNKFITGIGSANDLTGTVLAIKLFVFVENAA